MLTILACSNKDRQSVSNLGSNGKPPKTAGHVGVVDADLRDLFTTNTNHQQENQKHYPTKPGRTYFADTISSLTSLANRSGSLIGDPPVSRAGFSNNTE